MKKVLLLVVALLFLCGYGGAQTINAASCSQSDVQTAFSAITASTLLVNIPACSGGTAWTTQVTLVIPSGSTNLSIVGAGSLTTTGGGDQTVFVDNSTSNDSLLEITTNATSTSKFRVAGITFKGGSGAVKYNGFIEVKGSSQNIRFDHMHLDPATYSTATPTAGTRWNGCTAGVIDHIIWDAASGQVNNAVQNYNAGACYGETDGLGHASWANPTNPGTATNYMYVETSVFNNGSSNDCLQGGRFVSRFNTYNQTGPSPTVQTHPTGSDGGFRGCRAQEVYENTMTAAPGSYLNANVWVNSGTALVWGNTAPSSAVGGGTGFKNFIELLSTRQNNATYPQIATPSGWGYCGTSFNGTGSNWDENTSSVTGYHCMDDAGRGAGDLLTGGFTSDGSGTDNVTNTATSCTSTSSCAYPRQASEPIYEWMDAYSAVPSNPSNVIDNSSEPTAHVNNTDYFMWCDASRSGFTSPQNCTSFTGAGGTGSGVIASRPSTCTTGVLYWATDQGSWNQSGSGSQGLGYKCTATNTWTLFYTPLTYPHPLTLSNVITAASCSSTDVQTALSAVTAATTIVNIPACSGGTAWTAPVSVTLPSTGNLTIQGTTTITGNCSPSSPSCTATDGTVIVDNYASTNPLLTIVTQSGCTETRITGITLKGGTGLVKQTGMLAVNGTCQSVRVDHNHLLLNTSSLANIGVRYTGWVYGVMDHNLGDMTTATTSEFENTWTQGYGGGTMGEVAWSSPSALGTSAFMFVENNVINNGLYANDCDFGGRSVVRYNVLNNVQLQTHPTGSAPDAVRGCRAQEIYLNQLNGLSACNGGGGFGSCLYNGVFISSGTGVMWSNSFPLTSTSGTSSGYQWGFSIQSMRITNSTYSQAATPTGWGYCGTAFNGTGSNWDENTPSTTGYACLDQPGRGQGDLLSGNFPSTVNSTTGTIAWPHQALEPYYEWLDTLTPIPSNPSGIVTNSSPTVLSANTDYYIYNASFTGASGTGSGLLSARPSTCTPLTAYWATDTQTLYQCATTNTWTTYYAPYTYPHPLVSGTVTVANPTASPSAGTYTSTQSVTLSTVTSGATICYTTDGSTPTATTPGTCLHGTTYSTAISVSTTQTITAIGTLSGATNSSVTSFAYTIAPLVATPTASPAAGTYSSTQSVALSTSTGGATICYTTNGSTPSAAVAGTCDGGSTTYTTAISVASSLTIKAIGTLSGDTNSGVLSSAYVITGASHLGSLFKGTMKGAAVH